MTPKTSTPGEAHVCDWCGEIEANHPVMEGVNGHVLKECTQFESVAVTEKAAEAAFRIKRITERQMTRLLNIATVCDKWTLDSEDIAAVTDAILEIRLARWNIDHAEPADPPVAGVAKFFGTWPGDETDAELLGALDEIRKPAPVAEEGAAEQTFEEWWAEEISMWQNIENCSHKGLARSAWNAAKGIR